MDDTSFLYDQKLQKNHIYKKIVKEAIKNNNGVLDEKQMEAIIALSILVNSEEKTDDKFSMKQAIEMYKKSFRRSFIPTGLLGILFSAIKGKRMLYDFLVWFLSSGLIGGTLYAIIKSIIEKFDSKKKYHWAREIAKKYKWTTITGKPMWESDNIKLIEALNYYKVINNEFNR